MVEDGSLRPITAEKLFPMDRLSISFHALSRFSQRQGLPLSDAAEQLRPRLSKAILVEKSEGGKIIHRSRREKARRGLPEYILRDAQDPAVRYIVRVNERGAYFLATTYSVKRVRHKRKRA